MYQNCFKLHFKHTDIQKDIPNTTSIRTIHFDTCNCHESTFSQSTLHFRLPVLAPVSSIHLLYMPLAATHPPLASLTPYHLPAHAAVPNSALLARPPSPVLAIPSCAFVLLLPHLAEPQLAPLALTHVDSDKIFPTAYAPPIPPTARLAFDGLAPLTDAEYHATWLNARICVESLGAAPQTGGAAAVAASASAHKRFIIGGGCVGGCGGTSSDDRDEKLSVRMHGLYRS